MSARAGRRATAHPLAVFVQVACRSRALPSARSLRAWARAATGRHGGAVTLRLAGAAEARRLNSAYRRRDYATNVLSFAYAEPRRGAALRGDIVLCHPVIAREAKAQRKPLAAHYAHLVVHGVLHLCGLDHRGAAQARFMEAKEKRLLRILGFDDPYAVPGAPSAGRTGARIRNRAAGRSVQ